MTVIPASSLSHSEMYLLGNNVPVAVLRDRAQRATIRRRPHRDLTSVIVAAGGRTSGSRRISSFVC